MGLPSFKHQVYELVAQIPKGKVVTYGQIAYMCGQPQAARIVGGIAHHGPLDLPWQRVVKKDGSLAEGYPGSTEGHRAALEGDGVKVDQYYRVDMEHYLWRPETDDR